MPAPRVPPELLNPVLAYFQPLRVILIGPETAGQAQDTAITLLVVLRDDASPDQLTVRAGREARGAYTRPANVIPCYEEFFHRLRHIPGTLPYVAWTEGTILYDMTR